MREQIKIRLPRNLFDIDGNTIIIEKEHRDIIIILVNDETSDNFRTTFEYQEYQKESP